MWMVSSFCLFSSLLYSYIHLLNVRPLQVVIQFLVRVFPKLRGGVGGFTHFVIIPLSKHDQKFMLQNSCKVVVVLTYMVPKVDLK